MTDKKFYMTLENFSETISQIESELSKTKATKKESMNAQLLLEETFMRMINNGKAESVQVKISKRFGDLTLQLESEGEEYNPLVSFTDYDEDDEDYFRTIILKANAQKMSYTRKNNKNLVIIQIHENTNKQLHYTLIAMVAGIIFGGILKFAAPPEFNAFFNDTIAESIQTMFMNALNMMIVPVVFFSIITGVTGVTNAADVGRIGGRLISLYFLTTTIAIFCGLGLANIVFSTGLPQVGIVEGTIAEQAEFSFVTMIVNIIPKNLIDPIVNRDMLQIIFLALLFGLFINKLGDKVKLLSNFIQVANTLCLTVLSAIMSFIPIATFFAMAMMILSLGMETIALLGKLLAAIVIADCFMILVYSVILRIIGKTSPIPFLKKIPQFMPMPFATSSSNATMPFTMKFCTEKFGISPKISSFSIPLGATINMDGTGTYQSLTLIMLLKMYGVEIDANAIFILIVSIFTLTIGTPGIPFSGIVLMAAILGVFGVPSEAIAITMGIASIEDRVSTVTNVVGDIAVTTTLAARENLLNKDIYAKI